MRLTELQMDTTSAVEVTNISAHGIWLLAHGQELFLPCQEFPWFKDQPVRTIMNVEEQAPGHFHWPEIDVDFTREIIKQRAGPE
jgi:hypothetical protein